MWRRTATGSAGEVLSPLRSWAAAHSVSRMSNPAGARVATLYHMRCRGVSRECLCLGPGLLTLGVGTRQIGLLLEVPLAWAHISSSYASPLPLLRWNLRVSSLQSNRDVVFLSGARTGFGTFGGALKDLSATDLGVIAAQAALERGGVEAKSVDHVVFGNVLQTSADAIYLARHIGLRAGA